jgi:type IV/VI secretion system ImpK/VasF family protein
MNLSAEAAQALRTAHIELFWLAGQLRAGEIPGHRTLEARSFADATLRQKRKLLLRADVDDVIVSEIELAIVALLDESAQLSSAKECADTWMARLLQYEYYRHSNLGRDFFERLEILRQRADTPLPVLELFARCLAWGFEGRYREENRLEDLRVLRDALRVELYHRLPRPPLCLNMNERSERPKPPPLFTAPWVLGLGAALLLLLGGGLTGLLYLRANATAESLKKLSGSADRAGE